jgi:hypothetical protein
MRSTPVVVLVVVSLALGSSPAWAAASQTVTVTGTAKKEAKRPYTNYLVRARQVDTGQIAASVPLDGSANFEMTGMTPASYLMELVNSQGKVVCTAGPFAAGALTGLNIDCDKKKPSAAWLLLAAAGAAGVTAAVLASPDDSADSTAGVGVASFGAPPASPSR